MRAVSPNTLLWRARWTRISMFSAADTCSAPRAANVIMLDGSFEARIWSIMRAIASQPGTATARNRPALGQRLELAYSQLKVPGNAIRFVPQKFVPQRSIVPKSALAATVETGPHRLSHPAIIAEDGADVIELVGGRHQMCLGVFPLQ